MATADSISELSSPPPPPAVDLLVLAPPLLPDNLETLLTNLASVFPAEGMLIATPSQMPAQTHPGLRMIASPPANSGWSLTAANFLQAWQLSQEHNARAILILGPGSDSLRPDGLQLLANGVLTGSLDLALSRYTVPAHTGMINSAILYPLTRALFASRVRFPLAIDLVLSPRMAQHLAGGAGRFAQPDQPESLLWPVNEAVVAGFAVDDFDVGVRTLPQPAEQAINAILARVTGSIFADIEQKAVYWQRARRAPAPRNNGGEISTIDAAGDVPRTVEAFRLAYNNLLEIWSLVLPPQSLLGLKRLSQMNAEEFRMPDGLWARIVYDFLIAYRQRTINRGHLLGALIPLYLGWVAGHINLTNAGTSAEAHNEAVAAAFEEDKPYVVSRWRWPDRFNA